MAIASILISSNLCIKKKRANNIELLMLLVLLVDVVGVVG